MTASGPGAILDEFDRRAGALERLRGRLEEGLRELLRSEGIHVHALSARVKGRASLQAKVARPDKTYHSLWEVTDLVGLRITTYFEDTIEQVASLIERSFAVDFHLSNDRLQFKDFRAFGYRSLHYVCGQGGAPSEGLPGELRFEIQVRTILQHAWAEIEHDLGYKASDSTPASIRRRFSRIAGLLEIADEEFGSIRRDLAAYESSLRDALLDSSRSFPLDRVSLGALTALPEATALDRAIAAALGRPPGGDVFFPEYLLKMLALAGFRNTHEVRQRLRDDADLVLELVAPYFDFTGKTWRLTASVIESVPKGYGLFFLSHVAILKSSILDQNKVTKVAQFYRELDYPHDEKAAYEVASGLLEAFRKAGCAAVRS